MQIKCENCEHFHPYTRLLKEEKEKQQKLLEKKRLYENKPWWKKLLSFEGWGMDDILRLETCNVNIKELEETGQCWLNPKAYVVGKTTRCGYFKSKK